MDCITPENINEISISLYEVYLVMIKNENKFRIYRNEDYDTILIVDKTSSINSNYSLDVQCWDEGITCGFEGNISDIGEGHIYGDGTYKLINVLKEEGKTINDISCDW